MFSMMATPQQSRGAANKQKTERDFPPPPPRPAAAARCDSVFGAAGSGPHPTQPELPSPYEKCNPEMAAFEQSFETLESREYWLRICPHLHIGERSLFENAPPFEYTKEEIQRITDIFDRDGYFVLPPSKLPFGGQSSLLNTNGGDTTNPIITGLARGVCLLMQHGLPPWFISMYDEAWLLAHQLGPLIAAVSGGNGLNMDFLAWYIDPHRGGAGFSPHRDRQPPCPASSFRNPALGTGPKVTTVWIPLTDVLPDNGCLYCMPRTADRGYLAGDDMCSEEDPLAAAIRQNPLGYQAIRALPAPAGAAIAFTHRLIHWGGATTAGYHTPRIAMAFAFSDDSFEAAYFSREEYLPCPPVELRAALAASQSIAYSRRFFPPRHELALLHRLFMRHADRFEANYAAKICSEYQWYVFMEKRDNGNSKGISKEEGGGGAEPTVAADGTKLAAKTMRKQQQQDTNKNNDAALCYQVLDDGIGFEWLLLGERMDICS